MASHNGAAMTPDAWPDRLLAVDVEGNGQSPPDLVEVALIPIRAGHADPASAWQALIRPPRPITSFATRVHKLTSTDVSDAPAWADVAGPLRSLLEGAWIAAHNAHVDYAALARHLPGWQPAGVLDTLRLARRAYPGRSGHSLDTMITRAGIDTSAISGQRHRASFDAHAAALLLITLAQPYHDWADLVAAAVPPGLPGSPSPPAPQADTLW